MPQYPFVIVVPCIESESACQLSTPRAAVLPLARVLFAGAVVDLTRDHAPVSETSNS